jgi:hypothetical protein
MVLTKRGLFVSRANDTPVVSGLVDSQLAELRDAGEITILGRRSGDGTQGKPLSVRQRTREFQWSDEIRLTRQRPLFSIFPSLAA